MIEYLGLEPLEPEGGYFHEIYRSQQSLALDGSKRDLLTHIFYLLRGDQISNLHVLGSDELWHFYAGGTLELVLVTPQGKLEHHRLGRNPANDEKLFCLVPANTWQGARIIDGEGWSLVGTSVAPGFEYDDFKLVSSNQVKDLTPSLFAELEQFLA